MLCRVRGASPTRVARGEDHALAHRHHRRDPLGVVAQMLDEVVSTGQHSLVSEGRRDDHAASRTEKPARLGEECMAVFAVGVRAGTDDEKVIGPVAQP